MVVAAAVAVGIGTAVGLGRGSLAWPLSAAAGAALVAAAVTRKGRVAGVVVLFAVGCSGSASAAWRAAAETEALLPRLAARNVLVHACGTVRLRRPRSVEIQAEAVSRGDSHWRTREPLRVSGERARRAVPGQRICARGPLAPPRPGRREAPLLAARQFDSAGSGSLVRSAAARVRRSFSAAARQALPRTQAGLLLGMTDGDVELIDERTMETFRTTGLAHLVAVSGSNVAVVLTIVVLITRALVPRGRWLRAAVAVPPLVFFAFLTGLEPSVLRAVFTAGVALAVTAGGRTTDGLRIASFAFIGLIFTTPELLTHPGFQLSFGATLGLILWARPLALRLERLMPQGRVGCAVAACIATTSAAQAAVAPLLAWHFGRVPALGGVANLVVAPLAPLVMLGGAATLGLASTVPAVDWLPAMLRLPLDVILFCARWFAALPAASLAVGIVIGVAITAALAAFAASDARLRRAGFAVAVALAAAGGGQAVARGSFSCAAPAVHAVDVGQGTAVLLQADGHAVLVDTGPAGSGVAQKVKALGVDDLDAVFVSHPHIDHALGTIDLLDRLDVGQIVGPVTLGWGGGSAVLNAAEDAGVPVTIAAAGDEFAAGPMRIDVLWPPPGPAPPFSEDLVDPLSLVLHVEIGGTDLLLPGDIRSEQQSELAQSITSVPLLVAPHHGSKNLDAEFVAAVAPRLTLVTVGAPNPYGLPAPEAIRAYSRYGRVFRTDQDGRVSVCLRDSGAEVVTER